LRKAHINKNDADKYLQIIEERVISKKNGAQWQLDSFNRLKKEYTPIKALMAVTGGMVKRQKQNTPVHQWTLASIDELGSLENHIGSVRHIMSTDLLTVQPNDPIDLVVSMIRWHNISHIPVEDGQRKLVGLITTTTLISSTTGMDQQGGPRLAKDIMIHNPIVVSENTGISEALELITKNKIGCLPVLEENRLIGMVTATDLVKLAKELIHEIEQHR
jgi:CBS domain-containing protein